MRRVLNRMKNQLSDFGLCSFLYEKFIKNWPILSKKTAISHKLKIAKWNFQTFQIIPHLWCKFGHFWRKKFAHGFIHAAKKKFVGGFWTPHALRMRTLASLVSVNGIFRKSLFSLLHASKSIEFFFSKTKKNLHERCGFLFFYMHIFYIYILHIYLDPSLNWLATESVLHIVYFLGERTLAWTG